MIRVRTSALLPSEDLVQLMLFISSATNSSSRSLPSTTQLMATLYQNSSSKRAPTILHFPIVSNSWWLGTRVSLLSLYSRVTIGRLLLFMAIEIINHPPPSYKREAFRGSEFAPRVLADSGIPVVLKVPYNNLPCLVYLLTKDCSQTTPL